MATKSEQDLTRLKEMWAKYKQLADGYQGFKLETLIVRYRLQDQPEEWRFLSGWLIALDAKAPVPESRTMDYGACVYEQSLLTEEQALKFLNAIATDRRVILSGHEIVLPDHASVLDRGYTPIPYWDKVGPFAHHFFSFRFSDINLNFSEPIFGKGIPPYPDIRALSHEKFDTDISTGGWNGEFLIFLPQYAARIEKVEFGRRRVTAHLEVSRPGMNGYKLGLWARKGESHFHDEQPVRKNKVTFRLKEHPEQVMLFLTDGESKRLIHQWGGKQDNVPAETELAKPNEWLKRIAEGEGPTSEFKHYPEPKHGHKVPYSQRIDKSDLARELAAFSNTEGGTVFLGVDDLTGIHNVDDLKDVKDLIANVVSTLCDPPLTPKLAVIPMGDKKIVTLSVQPGDDIRAVGGRIYVRRLGTTRPASAAEIKELVEGKADSQDIYGVGPIVLGMRGSKRKRPP